MSNRTAFSKFFATVIFLAPAIAGAWGEDGHRLLAKVGAHVAQTNFWNTNADGMAYLSQVPDIKWKSLKTADIEKPTHFFQPDSYFASPAQFSLIPHSYTQAVHDRTQTFVDANGTSVWRIQQFFMVAVDAVRNNDFTQALELAGVMSHYVGDNSQPLHLTKNYDGQETGQTGIHAFFETTNIQNANQANLVADVEKQARALLASSEFVKMKTDLVSNIVFNEVDRAYGDKDKLLQIDQSEGRSGTGSNDLLNLAVNRLADGSATLSILLDMIWQQAGNPTQNGLVKYNSNPAWLAPDFSKL